MFVAGYRHFLSAAASLQWDEAAVDLSADARAWPALRAPLRARIRTLVAGFCVGEAAVAEEIAPFAGAAHGPDAAACFRAQEVDEQRHARFFDRVAAEVMGVEGRTAAERRAVLRGVLGHGFVALFEARLPAAARALVDADGGGRPDRRRGPVTPGPERASEPLRAAVALYHLVLEGVVFTAGQWALLAAVEQAGGALPGLREGIERVLADERWHVGLGARLLAEAGVGEPEIKRLVSAAEPALAAWGDAVDPELAARVLRLHRRRLGAAYSSRRRLSRRRPRPAAPARRGRPC